MKILSENDFYNQVTKYANSNVSYWMRKRAKQRWLYYSEVVNIVKNLDFKTSLEAGTMGIKVIDTSDEIDFNTESKYQCFSPAYNHNLKTFPWPIENERYDLFIATRVFQHLMPFQKQCFKEAARISKNIILVIPILNENDEKKKIFSNQEIIDWNDGVLPTSITSSKYDDSKIIFWNNLTLSKGLKK